MARFGSLIFAKRWLVCRAKGNVPSAFRFFFLRVGKKTKSFVFQVCHCPYIIFRFQIHFLFQVCSLLSF